MRLIDADALKQRIREKFDGLIERIEINSVINAQPTADVVERKRGEWIAYNGDDSNWLRNDGSPVFMQCSECNTMVVNNFAFNWNYCPNCGADMRGGNNDIH